MSFHENKSKSKSDDYVSIEMQKIGLINNAILDTPHYIERLADGVNILWIDIPEINLFHLEWIVKGTGTDHTRYKEQLQSFHLLEHMVSLLSSSKYPSGQLNIDRFTQYGIDFNASTEMSFTSYFLKGLIQYVGFGLDLLLNTAYDFKLDLLLFENEKKSVLTELQGDDNRIWNPFFEYMDSILYPNTARSQSIY